MGEIIESTLASIDGVIEDPASWAGHYVDADFQQAAFERLLVSEAMVMGRHTYELLGGDWASQSGNFADRINGIPKYVVSTTLGNPTWKNSTIIRSDAVNEIRKLKEQTGTDLAIYGHGLLAQTLLEHGLLDEIQLSIFPLFVGHGKQMFREGQYAPLRLIDATTLRNGVVVMRYQPVSPPA